MSLCLIFLMSILSCGRPIGEWNKTYDAFIRSGESLYSLEDRDLLAEVMYHENYCNGDYIMLLTGSVVLNRVKASWFPNDIRGVLYQKGQYATVPKFYTTKIPKRVYDLAEHLLICGSHAPDKVVFQSMHPNLGTVWYEENGEYFSY